MGVHRDDIASHLVSTLTKKFWVGASDADGLARFISTMLEKSATESAAAARMEAEREVANREVQRKKRKEDKRTRPIESLSPKAKENELKKQHKETLKKQREEEGAREEEEINVSPGFK